MAQHMPVGKSRKASVCDNAVRTAAQTAAVLAIVQSEEFDYALINPLERSAEVPPQGFKCSFLFTYFTKKHELVGKWITPTGKVTRESRVTEEDSARHLAEIKSGKFLKKVLAVLLLAFATITSRAQAGKDYGQAQELKEFYSDEQLQKMYPLHFTVTGFSSGPGGCLIYLREADETNIQGQVDTVWQHGKCLIPPKGAVLMAHSATAKWNRPGDWIMIPFVEQHKVQELKIRVISEYQ